MSDVLASVLIALFLLSLLGVVFWTAFHSTTPDMTLPTDGKDKE